MFGISLKFTKKLLEAGDSPQTPLGKFRTHPRPLVGSSLSVPLPRGVQRHPGNAKCVTEIFRGDKIKKLGDRLNHIRLNVVS